jgi:hypothetical protein
MMASVAVESSGNLVKLYWRKVMVERRIIRIIKIIEKRLSAEENTLKQKVKIIIFVHHHKLMDKIHNISFPNKITLL